jgi:hypothetical protein
VDLVRGTAHDDHGACKSLTQLGECESGTDDGPGNAAVSTRVDWLDLAVRPHGRNSVVEADETNRLSGALSAQAGAEGGLHPSNLRLNHQACAGERVAEVA